MTVSELYRNPLYYEIAFSFRDLDRQMAVMEEAMDRYSRIPVTRVLEIACGNGPHVPLWLRHGRQYVGIDLSEPMLRYTERKAARCKGNATLLQCDLADFTLDEPVDFACVLLGSLYVKTTAQLRSHFDCVARALRPGGLYFLDWCVDFDPMTETAIGWECARDGIRVRTSYWTRHADRVAQTYEENVLLEIDDNGVHKRIHERCLKRAVYPQEFLLFVETHPCFEFVGWWNEWDFDQPIDGADIVNRPIALVRRTGY